MKHDLLKSFRFKIILFSLLSLFMTFLTEGFIYYIGYVIYKILNHDTTYDLEINNNQYFNYFTEEGVSNNIANGARKVQETANSTNIINQGFLVFLFIFGIVLAFVLFTVYLSLLTRRYGTYLMHITEGMNLLSQGNFDTRIEEKYNDELTMIARNLNKMAVDVKAIIENERSSENRKNELITNVAHDLRTPLTSIIGYLEIVSKKQLQEDIKNKYITIAYDKSKRLEKLIEDLFSYTKFEFGEVILYKEEVDIVKLMEQLLEEFYPSFEENELEYSFRSNEKNVTIMADGNLLARAFANLIGNAIKYGAAGKNVKLIVKKEIKDVSISIVNFGEIIPESAIEHIFDKFYRADTSRSEQKGGSGLGLAIAKNIIEMHRGSITVKSDFEGTKFNVQLPLY